MRTVHCTKLICRQFVRCVVVILDIHIKEREREISNFGVGDHQMSDFGLTGGATATPSKSQDLLFWCE